MEEHRTWNAHLGAAETCLKLWRAGVAKRAANILSEEVDGPVTRQDARTKRQREESRVVRGDLVLEYEAFDDVQLQFFGFQVWLLRRAKPDLERVSIPGAGPLSIPCHPPTLAPYILARHNLYPGLGRGRRVSWRPPQGMVQKSDDISWSRSLATPSRTDSGRVTSRNIDSVESSTL